MIKLYEGQDRVFLKACELAKTDPTRRQYTKYLKQMREKAFAVKEEAKTLLGSNK